MLCKPGAVLPDNKIPPRPEPTRENPEITDTVSSASVSRGYLMLSNISTIRKSNGPQIYEYKGGPQEHSSPLQGRLQWNGSKDMQDVSITIINVTMNDSGVFTCNVTRTLHFEVHRHLIQSSKLIHLKVTEEASEDFTSVVSEIMMYILLAFLTLWLMIEMVYCYRKISKAEELTQESVTDYLAIPSENKENCSVPVEE
ncbi:sodium channel regulatory subunit beta-3 isoform X2 [Ascaphus truei]|uniref:sodium channel regulatory subunit beta-3 isoform X2 n=1 Tax=Ascaphus truei TaxID=8439 RepID=UPI003F59EF19